MLFFTNMRIKALTLSFLFFTALGTPFFSVYASETVLQYSLVETRTPVLAAKNKTKKIKETRVASKKKVVLGKDFFSVKEGQLERIYDFKNRKVYYLDHREKSAAEISLFADPAFRLHELQYRLKMMAAVEKAGGTVPEDLFTLESIFGIESNLGSSTLSEDNSEKGKTKLLVNGKNVAEVSWSEKYPLPDKEMFSKFLIYDNSLHPVLRSKILGHSQIPDVIRSQLQNPDSKDQFVLILDGLKSQPDQGFQIPANYVTSKKLPGSIPEAESIRQLIESVRLGKNKTPRYQKVWFEERRRQAESKKDYLDAALIVLEYGFQTGDQKTTSEVMSQLSTHQAEDAELDRFLRSLGVDGKEQAERAVSELEKIDRKKLSRAHVIDVFIANQLSVLGKNGEAEKRMLAALRINPYIAGAYKDLGDMFFADFDMATAWLCWDFGRSQVPDHFMLKPISDFEAELLKNMPEFF